MPYLIESSRLRFRQLTSGDMDFVLALTNDPDWLYYIGEQGITDSKQAFRYVNSTAKGFAENGLGLFVVESHVVQGDCRIGLCGFLSRSFLTVPDLGYAFLPHGRGLGLAREAVSLALKWIANFQDCTQVSALCRYDNQRSLMLLHSVGFFTMGRFFQRGAAPHQLLIKQVRHSDGTAQKMSLGAPFSAN